MKILVVCAHLMDAKGVLNKESKGRCAIANDIFRKLKCHKIIVPGCAYRDDSEVAISSSMKSYLISKYKLPPSDIVEEVRSRDTVGDAIFCRLAFDKYIDQLTDIIVITSNYHVLRALRIFRFVFGSNAAVSSPISFYVEPKKTLETHEMNSLKAFEKTFSKILPGDIRAILEALKNNHPFYNGEKFPKMTPSNFYTDNLF